jgi:protein transport protein SEC23
MLQKDMKGLKRGLRSAVQDLDMSNTRVMLASFSRNLFLHLNPGTSRFTRQVTVSCANKIHHLTDLLGIKTPKNQTGNSPLLSEELLNKLFFSTQEALLRSIDNLSADHWVTPNSERPQRATGRCLEMVHQLLSRLNIKGVRFIAFISGPSTVSGGRVASLPLSEFMRKAVDLEKTKEIQKLCLAAIEFYDNLASRFVANEYIFDLFAHSLDQFGLYEMRKLLAYTGGTVYLDEEFEDERFDETLKKHLSKEKIPIYNENQAEENEEEEEVQYTESGMNLMSEGRLEIRLSKQLKVVGCLGNVKSLKEKKLSQMIGTNTFGEGNTTAWYSGSMDFDSTYTFLLEVAERQRVKAFTSHIQVYFQILAYFKHPNGQKILRVITMEKPMVGYKKPVEILEYIDQLSLVISIAKIAGLRSLKQDSRMVTRFVDKSLINIMKKFQINGNIPQNLNLLPQYFYYLRKSVFVLKFGTSLDEMAYFRLVLLRENTSNCMVMIQPQVLQYSLNEEEGIAVLPDSSCMKKDKVLLADTYFNFVIWQGLNIKQWVDQGYHEKEGFENVAQLVEAPDADIHFINQERFFLSKTIRCYFGSPNERFLKAKLNPEKVENNGLETGVNEIEESGNFISDEASLSDFMAKLLKFISKKK